MLLVGFFPHSLLELPDTWGLIKGFIFSSPQGWMIATNSDHRRQMYGQVWICLAEVFPSWFFLHNLIQNSFHKVQQFNHLIKINEKYTEIKLYNII